MYRYKRGFPVATKVHNINDLGHKDRDSVSIKLSMKTVNITRTFIDHDTIKLRMNLDGKVFEASVPRVIYVPSVRFYDYTMTFISIGTCELLKTSERTRTLNVDIDMTNSIFKFIIVFEQSY